MSQLEHANFFVKQNIWIKLAILLLGSVAAVAVPAKALNYLLGISFFYFLVSPGIINHLLAGLKAILPFLAAYSLFATVLSIPFPDILVFILRMIVLVFFLVYFIASLHINRVLEDIQPLKKHKFFQNILFYALSTLLYLKQLVDYYRSRDMRNQTSGKKQFMLSGLVDAIHTNWQLRDNIQSQTDALLSADYSTPWFVTKNNVMGCLFITLIILIMSL
jgi:hypothetical protein